MEARCVFLIMLRIASPDTKHVVGAFGSRGKFFLQGISHPPTQLFILFAQGKYAFLNPDFKEVSEAQISKVQPIPPEGVVSAIPNVKLTCANQFHSSEGVVQKFKKMIFFKEENTNFRFSCAVCAAFSFPPHRGIPGIRIPQSQFAFPLSDNWDQPAILRLVRNDFNVLEDILLCFKPCP